MVFLPGVHNLEEGQVRVANVGNFSMIKEASVNASTVMCSGSGCGGFYFDNVSHLLVSGLAFTADRPSSYSISAVHVQEFLLVNCTFANSSSKTALFGDKSNLFLDGNTFANNSVEGPADSFPPGAGIGLISCNLTFQGQNSFLNNSCSGGACRGGAIYGEASRIIFKGNTSFVDNSVINSAQVKEAFGGGGFLFIGSTVDIAGHVSFIDNVASNADFLDGTCQICGGGAYLLNSNASVSGDVVFLNNSARGKSGCGGGFCLVGSSVVVTGSTEFRDNYAGYTGGGWFIGSTATNITGMATFSNNSAMQGGGIAIMDSTASVSGSLSVVNNSGSIAGGGVLLFGSNVTITNVECRANTAEEGGGIVAEASNTTIAGEATLFGNLASYNGGGVVVIGGKFNVNGTMKMMNNSAVSLAVTGNNATIDVSSEGGGMVLKANGSANVIGRMMLTTNSAVNGHGGGMAIDATSYLVVTGKAFFTGNRAGMGGAIFVHDATDLIYCSSEVLGGDCLTQDCFFQIPSLNNGKLIMFKDNVAKYGDVLFGGSIDRCRLKDHPGAQSGKVFDTIADTGCKQQITESLISSPPFRVCLCEDDQPHCTANRDITAYPGETFSVRVTAVGQRNGTVLASINADVTPADLPILGGFEQRQEATGCTDLHYTLHSKSGQVDHLFLYVHGSCSNSLQFKVSLRYCPPAFELSESIYGYGCTCEERLQKYTNSCDINHQTILRDGAYWVGYDNQSQYLILHPHCPFYYCKGKPINFTLDEIDLQCQHNRTGLLCGACSPGLSLALGSSRCLPCSDSTLALIPAFSAMGLAFVLFLLVLRFTITVGTIGGLIFYVSIVGANRRVFFPPYTANYLVSNIFISWFSLDYGFETCFYNGMDTYAKTWLQFVFPSYTWGIVVLLILFLKCYKKFWPEWPDIAGKLHAHEVLVTLFAFSYGKIVHTIIATVSHTSLEYPNKTEVVWLHDANIKYLHGKHIPLVTVSALFFVLFVVPFTSIQLLGDAIKKLLARGQRNGLLRICMWLKKPVDGLLYIFYAPFNPKYHYWPGLLLVVRLGLNIVFGVNALRDNDANLLAISVVAFGLLAWPWFPWPTKIFTTDSGTGDHKWQLTQGHVYKSAGRGALEVSYILNVGIFSVATFYVRQMGGNQAVVAYISSSVAFASFILTCFFHVHLRKNFFGQCLKAVCQCWRKVRRKRNRQVQVEESSQENRPLIKKSHKQGLENVS